MSLVAGERMKKVNTADSFKMQQNKSLSNKWNQSDSFCTKTFKIQTSAENFFLFRLCNKVEEKTSVRELTAATLYLLLGPRTGRQSVLWRLCSAKTQQHKSREEVRILSAVGSRGGGGGAQAGWWWWCTGWLDLAQL